MVVVGVTLVVMLLAALLSLLGRPGYTSSAQVYVAGASTGSATGSSTGSSSGSSSGQSTDAVSRRVASFVTLAQSRQLATRVDRRLDLAGSPADLQGRIHAEAVPGTMLMRLDVTASTATNARRNAAGVLAELDRLGRTIGGAASGTSSPLRTATGPSLPVQRDGRHLTRNVLAIGLPVGIVAGLLAALVLARRPRPVSGRHDVEAVLAAPVLGELTLDRDGSGSGDAEGVEDLRDNVRFLGIDQAGPLLVVAGAGDQRDVVDCAIGLATSIARTGAPVLLVDGDLRSGELASRLGLAGEPGLSSVLVGDLALADAVQVAPDSGVHVLTAGPSSPNPGDLVASASLRRLLAAARAEHRTVIVVAPDRGVPDDAARLSAAADGALLVVRPGSLSTRELHQAERGVSARGGTVLGTVLVRSTASPTPLSPVSAATAATAPAAVAPVGPPASVDIAAEPDVRDEPDEPDEPDEEQTAVPAIFADPEPWPEERAASPDLEERVEPPWAIRETPDNPEPFWLAGEAGPDTGPVEETRALSAVEIEAEVLAAPAPEADPTDEPTSPWLSREGEEWTPPVPAVVDDPGSPAAPWVGAEPQPVEPPRPDPLTDPVSEPGAQATSPTIADRVAESLQTRRADATLGEPTRRGPLTAGELAGLPGPAGPSSSTDLDGPTDQGRDETPPEAPEVTTAEPYAPAAGRATDEALDGALVDDEPWAEDLAPRADLVEPQDSPETGPETGPEEGPESDEPRTGSLLDEFLTEDEDDEGEGVDPGPEPRSEAHREDRGSLWRPRRRRDG